MKQANNKVNLSIFTKYTLFISDLHLDASQPKKIQLFLDFLEQQAAKADALYILGDFFEVWIGDDATSSFHKNIIAALKKLTQAQVPVYIMHGNRDFLLGGRFLQNTGCQLLADPTLINLYGTPTLLMHGDTLCLSDTSYLRFRRWARHPFYQKAYLALPLSWRQHIANKLRKKSQQRAQKSNYLYIDADENEAMRMMLAYHAQLLIHGHTHRPSIQYFLLDGHFANRIVLSDWEETGNVLVCDSSGVRRLLNLH
jgi:UDP-2,3-diacylglucosamine hydrolase